VPGQGYFPSERPERDLEVSDLEDLEASEGGGGDLEASGGGGGAGLDPNDIKKGGMYWYRDGRDGVEKQVQVHVVAIHHLKPKP
jgi:hypothetical protein